MANMKGPKIIDDLSIVLCGEAGQGIVTVEKLLSSGLKLAGFNVSATKEYMSRVRGGVNSTQIRVTSQPRAAYLDRIDVLVAFDKAAFSHLEKRLSDKTLVLGDKERLGSDREILNLPLVKIAAELGSEIYSNTVAAGVLLSLVGVEYSVLEQLIKTKFGAKSEEIVSRNLLAAKAGFGLGKIFLDNGAVQIKIAKDPKVKQQIIVNGAEMLSMGAISGGCNFISAYPMTPSTGIISFLSQHAGEFGVIAEQAEDEISAVNMAIGAWYAGARALVSTAGGGFALMTEGISLAGMIESPLVVSVGMRPAPATGLPTRTEQGDLDMVLYAGHGEFPRIILAPGTLDEAFFLMHEAFNLADKFQVPVFVLSDQYLADLYYNIAIPDISKLRYENVIERTTSGYKRYIFAGDGISPRGIPGFGDGFVCVDSDEHDEDGHITESADIRKKMVDKRLKKLETLKSAMQEPKLIGPEKYDNLVVAWGSNYGIIKEALEAEGLKDTAMLHFSQLYPVHPKTAEYLKKAKKTAIVENNASSQFGRLIKLYTDFDIKNKILKYNGAPFSVEEIIGALRKLK